MSRTNFQRCAESISVVVLVSTLTLHGCNSSSGAAEHAAFQFVASVELDAELLAAMQDYYGAESSKDWARTYRYRPEAFRTIVGFDAYARQMSKDSIGWQLLRVEIMTLESDSEGQSVHMRFTEGFDETVAMTYFDGRVPAGENTWEGIGLWQKTDSGWTCVDAVSRNHLTLNGRLTN